MPQKRSQSELIIDDSPRDGIGGSTFCPYIETSKNYDKTRRTLGRGCTLGSFAVSSCDLPLSSQKLLDVGGGTGSFVSEVRSKFADVTLFEYDLGMLNEARNRLGKSVTLLQGSADDLGKLPKNGFHAATMNQVIHHFPAEDNYAFLAKTFQEIYGALAPGGALVLNHCDTKQHQDGYWWFKLMPKACEKYCERSPPMSLCIRYMREAGFDVDESEIYVPLEGTLMSAETYFKEGLESAFSKTYRDGDSGWTMGELTGELEPAQAEIRKIQQAGKEAAWIAEREAARKAVGQATFVTARKPKVELI